MNKNKLYDSDIVHPLSDYFGRFDWENWKWLKQYYSWEEAHIVDFLRIDNINVRIKGSVVNKYE